MNFDRRIPEAMRSALGGPLSPLLARRNQAPALLDLQLRRDSQNTSHSWASLYVGLSTVLDVHVKVTNVWDGPGEFWLAADKAYRANGDFPDSWRTPMSIDQLAEIWPKVDRYLDRVIPEVGARFTEKEGVVHAAMCSGRATSYRVIDREASPAFKNDTIKKDVIRELGAPLHAAIAKDPCREDWWPAVRYAANPKQFGTSPDILGVDGDGRLLIIEAKPPEATDGITWGPAQLRFYADLWARLLSYNPDVTDYVISMLEERVALGLTPPGPSTLARPRRIVPVLAIGAGRASRAALKRAVMVQEAIDAGARRPKSVAKTEFWILDPSGEPAAVLV